MKRIFIRTIIIFITLFYLFIGREYLKTFQYVYDYDGESITLNNYVEYYTVNLLFNNYLGKRNLTVPSYIIGRPVRSLEWTFIQYPFLKSVRLPNTVTTLGDNVFTDCAFLTDVSLPPNLESIGDFTFSKCESLTTLILPSKIKRIGKFAFSECKRLEAIELPDEIMVIETGTFFGCEALKEITIPDGTTSIQESAFQDCPSLEKIYIPDSVIDMGSDVFKDSPIVEIITPSGSFAEQYAIENKIPYKNQP